MNDRIAMRRYVVAVLAVCLGFLGVATVARADDAATVRAARLTSVQGAVTVSDAGNASGMPAQINMPLVQGVQVATGGDGEAEVEFEDGSVVRLTPNSALSLDSLAVAPGGVFSTGMSLLQGLAYLELRATQQYLYTLNAGGDVLSPVENTTVRVNFDQPPAAFAVLDGTAEVERQGGFQAQVRAGETMRDDATDPMRYFLTQGIDGDSWDQWNEDRDQAAAEASGSTAVRQDYAGAQGYGWSDLDANGGWYDVPGQGPVWQPDVAASDPTFDPYGYGEWVWYPGTGYVWASGYAWGWTPYRCGNWSYYGGFGWGWAPGAGCGGYGWGFAGGGAVVNIALVPRGYRPVRVPVGARAPQHPLITVHTWAGAQRGAEQVAVVRRGPRQVAGVTAAPIAPVRRGFTPGDTVAGSSLRKDYPIDRATKTPVMGLASTPPGVIHTNAGWRPAVGMPSESGAGADGGAASRDRGGQTFGGGRSYQVEGQDGAGQQGPLAGQQGAAQPGAGTPRGVQPDAGAPPYGRGRTGIAPDRPATGAPMVRPAQPSPAEVQAPQDQGAPGPRRGPLAQTPPRYGQQPQQQQSPPPQPSQQQNAPRNSSQQPQQQQQDGRYAGPNQAPSQQRSQQPPRSDAPQRQGRPGYSSPPPAPQQSPRGPAPSQPPPTPQAPPAPQAAPAPRPSSPPANPPAAQRPSPPPSPPPPTQQPTPRGPAAAMAPDRSNPK